MLLLVKILILPLGMGSKVVQLDENEKILTVDDRV